MALFQITPSEMTDKDLWLNSIRTELNNNIHKKCSAYNFDFIQGHPLTKLEIYDWLSLDAGINNEEQEESTRHSFFSHRENSLFFSQSKNTAPEIPTLNFQDLQI